MSIYRLYFILQIGTKRNPCIYANTVSDHCFCFVRTSDNTFFTYLDYNGGSIGKRKMGLKLAYKNKNYSSALVRNIIKFLPW